MMKVMGMHYACVEERCEDSMVIVNCVGEILIALIHILAEVKDMKLVLERLVDSAIKDVLGASTD